MINSIILSSNKILEFVNLMVNKRGIEITHIDIDKGIRFLGKINKKINSSFRGSIFIKEVNENVLLLESKDLSINRLGFFNLSNNFILKTAANIIGENYFKVDGENIIIDLDKLTIEIKDVYIKDKLLYITGSNIDSNLNA